MHTNLEHSLDLIIGSEGLYSNHPDDPGGPTMRGVTLATLAAWRNYPVTVEELKALGIPETRQIFQKQYSDKIDFDALPTGLDHAMLDAAVNSGPSRAVKLLQVLVGTEPDGVIGARTLAALADGMTTDALILAYSKARLRFMESLTIWGTFGNGWTKRVDWVTASAQAMEKATVFVAPANPSEIAIAKATGPIKITATASGSTALSTAISILAASGTIAAQATGFLSTYGDIVYIKYVLIALAVISSLSSLAVAWQNARAGHAA